MLLSMVFTLKTLQSKIPVLFFHHNLWSRCRAWNSITHE